mgnify:CR=1 FL=1
MDNIAKKECQNDVINLLQEKEYNDDGVRMFFRNFVNIEVEKQLKDEVNKYKEKQKRCPRIYTIHIPASFHKCPPVSEEYSGSVSYTQTQQCSSRSSRFQ